MKPLKITASIFFLGLSILTNAFASNAKTTMPGTIVVSIKPLYSLVAHLTEGVTQPALLMQQAQSAHHYNMRPSERRLLADASMIIWIGPQMETWLYKIIKQQSNAVAVISAMQADDLIVLKKRSPHSHGHEHESHELLNSHDKQDAIDPHIWLSTHNVTAIARHISRQLIHYNPENTGQYRKNLAVLLSKIEHTKDFIAANLTAQDTPFIVYHDAFQYFEHENSLNHIDTINFNEQTGTSLKQLRQIKRQITKYNIKCLIYKTPRPDVIDALNAQGEINVVALDPLGLNVDDDKNAWFKIMRQLTLNFSYCLTD